MVLESATLPVPSEVVLPFAGYLVFTGQMNFWIVVIVASIGSLVGTMIDYAIGFYFGRAAILRYGRYVRLSEKHLTLSENWFKKYGPITVLLARFVPLVRTLIAFPAGIAEMKMAKFLGYSVIGIVIWDAALTYVGYVVGQNWNTLTKNLQTIFDVVGIVAVVLAAIYLFFRWRRTNVEKVPEEKQPT